MLIGWDCVDIVQDAILLLVIYYSGVEGGLPDLHMVIDTTGGKNWQLWVGLDNIDHIVIAAPNENLDRIGARINQQ